MQKGLYRAYKAELGEECARIDMENSEVEAFLTRARYQAGGYEPEFDALPTEEDYVKPEA